MRRARGCERHRCGDAPAGVCEAEYGHIEHALVAGDTDVEMPLQLRDRTRRVAEPAIEGASAVLLSEMAEDELCRIVSACQLLEV